MKLIYLGILCSMITLRANAQREPDYGLYNVHIIDTAHNIQIQIIPVEHLPEAENTLFYYWYASNHIHVQQGGYSGRLLNGTYVEYDKQRNVREQGAFSKGLKNGIWKKWNTNGSLLMMEAWNKGLRSGPFTEFDANGKAVRSGYYKKGMVDGILTTRLGGDSVKYTRYRQGIEIKKKPKNFFKKLNIFRKRDTTQTQLKS